MERDQKYPIFVKPKTETTYMKVLFVSNNIYVKGNGICTSAQVTAKYLREAGVDVRFLTAENFSPDGPQPEFRLKRMHFPIFQPLLEANCFTFAVRDAKIMKEAVAWADVIHIEEPFRLQRETIKYAEEAGKPVVGTFHLFTQNILNEIPMASWGWTNKLYMKFWKRVYFDHCTDIQCPSLYVKQLLEENKFKARLHFFSNGTRIQKEPVVANRLEGAPYMILSVGRLTKIKGHRTLLEAMEYSRHSKEIKLHIAGKGVLKEKLQKYGRELVRKGVLEYEPAFEFHTHAELRKLARNSYLYVHNARMEVEGLGCLEAIREGTVPVIAKGEYIATSDFALDDRSTYPSKDAKALAERIDWWIEHPEERNRMAQKYADESRKYDIHNSVKALIGMYNQALGK